MSLSRYEHTIFKLANNEFTLRDFPRPVGNSAARDFPQREPPRDVTHVAGCRRARAARTELCGSAPTGLGAGQGLMPVQGTTRAPGLPWCLMPPSISPRKSRSRGAGDTARSCLFAPVPRNGSAFPERAQNIRSPPG